MLYDDRCDRHFGSWRAYDQHCRDSNAHWICHDCDDCDFTSWVGLKEHWVQSPRHDYCQYCDEHVDDINEHFNDDHFYCPPCQRVFKDAVGLREHYRQSERHHYCVPCDRLFMSASNLNNHLNSSVHRAKDVKCRCGNAFVSRAALVLHLESGTCSTGITRSRVNEIVRRNDVNNIITDPSRLIGGPAGSSSQEITYIATERSWNGYGYECCLCPNVFRTLPGLNQHLSSARHQEKIYICRGPVANPCGMRFSALSGYVQHVESDKCGIGRFKSVQSAMDNFLGQMGRLTL